MDWFPRAGPAVIELRTERFVFERQGKLWRGSRLIHDGPHEYTEPSGVEGVNECPCGVIDLGVVK